jgi:HAD superfamily hydrolase (TIGR01549 family)
LAARHLLRHPGSGTTDLTRTDRVWPEPPHGSHALDRTAAKVQRMAAVLFDFSGTLFRIESTESWLRAVLADSEVSLPELHDRLYDRHMAPAAWRPYPDTAEVLSALRERGVAVGVVSNIGWDLRPVFREHGLDPYIDAYVLSYEHGIQKPDPRLFATACEALGADPRDTLMVGDDRRADGGAAALGCEVHFVDHLPVTERPDGLRPVLDLVG